MYTIRLIHKRRPRRRRQKTTTQRQHRFICYSPPVSYYPIVPSNNKSPSNPSIMSSLACKALTVAYRNCLQDCRDAGRSNTASKTCKPYALKLDHCRAEWKRKNPSKPTTTTTTTSTTTTTNSTNAFDGTRILPNPECRPLSCQVQACIKWKQGDQTQCRPEIQALEQCMKTTDDVIVAPTDGDKVWSDYTHKK